MNANIIFVGCAHKIIARPVRALESPSLGDELDRTRRITD